MRSSVLLLLILGLLAGAALAHDEGQGSNRGRSDDFLSKEEIAEWHDKLYESTNALGAPGGGSSGLRGWTMMALAMFEASNVIDQDYSFYTVSRSSVPSSINIRQASRRVAVAKAAQVVLDGLFAAGNLANPGLRRYSHAAQFQAHTGRFDRQDPNYVNGVALGTFVGNAILANRATDGHPPPNVLPANGTNWWTYQYGLPYFPGNAQSAGYINVKPFAIPGYGPAGGDVTYVRPPLRNDSTGAEFAQFKAEWEELFSYGTSDPARSRRTAETDATARFHDGNFGSQIGNTIDILTSANIRDRGTDLLRIIALTAMSANDAHSNHWYWKYFYLNGRPITKYRQVPADEPAGLGAQRDVNWTPFLTTSQNPEHPSGHASRTGGLTASYRKAWGDNLTFRTISFSDPSAPARTYTSFTQFQNEVMTSRTYGGVHWRVSGPAGRDMAQRVTDYIWGRFLVPLRRGGDRDRDRNDDDD